MWPLKIQSCRICKVDLINMQQSEAIQYLLFLVQHFQQPIRLKINMYKIGVRIWCIILDSLWYWSCCLLPRAAPAGESMSVIKSNSKPGPNSSSLSGNAILIKTPNILPTTSCPSNLTIWNIVTTWVLFLYLMVLIFCTKTWKILAFMQLLPWLGA